MEIKACIFDLDGVVVDTAKYHFLAWQRLAKELDITFTETDNERLKGVSRIRSLEIILEIGNKTLSPEAFDQAATKKNAWYVAYIDQMAPDEILPGVLPFFDELKNKGIKIALGSASKNAMRILQKINMVPYFDAVIDGTKVSKAKPDPQVFLQGATALHTPAQNCVVFEDAEAGVEAALNGNMYCVGIGSPAVLGKAHHVMPGFVGVTFNALVQQLKNS